LYCILEKYENHPDYIRAVSIPTEALPPKVKTFKEFLNDILYSKLVQLEVLMQWYLDATKKQ